MKVLSTLSDIFILIDNNSQHGLMSEILGLKTRDGDLTICSLTALIFTWWRTAPFIMSTMEVIIVRSNSKLTSINKLPKVSPKIKNSKNSLSLTRMSLKKL